ncbi:MAG: hypothetical protein AABW90_04340 [Nanoarchaeota archaeon]
MVKVQLWAVIGVALVVAVIASIITASITGNVINVKENRRGPQVYTKQEVDKIFSNQKETSLDVFGRCEIKLGDSGVKSKNCNGVCDVYNQKCVFGRVDFRDKSFSDEVFEQKWVQSILTCNSNFSKFIHSEMNIGCVCCTPLPF